MKLPATLKFCTKCKRFRHLTDYYRKGKTRFQSYCKDCQRVVVRVAAVKVRADRRARAEFQRKLLDEKIKRGCKVKWSKFFKLINEKTVLDPKFNWDQRIELAVRSGDDQSQDQVYSIVDAEIRQTADGLLLTFEVDE